MHVTALITCIPSTLNGVLVGESKEKAVSKQLDGTTRLIY